MSLDSTKLPDPPMPSHTFTIYHRDVFEKSNFLDYDSLLESRIARCHARASHLASIFDDGSDGVTRNDNKNDANASLTRQQDAQGGKIRELVPKSTDTHSVHGEYVASFLIGSQLIKNYLLIDTGSGLLWWQCGPCEANNCYKQDQPLYNFTTSRISRKVDCIRHSSYCITADPAFHCDRDTSECIYNKKYTDGSGTKGFMADDVIYFVVDQRPIRVTFGCSNEQTGPFSSSYSGIVGLGRKVFPLEKAGYSLPSQFRAYLFSMCLPTFHSGKGSTLSFHISKWPRAISAKLLQNYKYPSFYFVNLYKVFVNEREVPVKPSWWNFKRDMSGGIFVDTGTTFTRFPNDFYVIFRYIFRVAVEDIPMVENPIGPFDTCYKVDPNGEELYFPVVKLYFGSVSRSTELILEQERVIVKYKGFYCLAFIGWQENYSILGVNQLQGVGLTFDTSANTLSFDINACD
ncbi:protein aspartic protease in guard cell 1 [Nicotiana attenuata]|uniref:Protein aspartic protease in guard cell 1 n=2 Tax=Nicotiana attenuata TaxID=49451 RepID=A0A314KIC5_NICAT|nr:protein aspartic protease in guard cell 1 [Nicotiana attenuata]